jgi:hypothetical protein
MLLFDDDMVILQENEDNLRESMYELQKLSNIYNFKISTTKTKVMASRGKYPIRSKVTLDDNSITEQVSDFNYLGCNVTYKYDEDLNKKINKFQSICGAVSRTLIRKTRKETNLKFYKVMATPVLLYGCETRTLKKRDWNRIQAAEMKYLRTVKGCSKLDQLRN